MNNDIKYSISKFSTETGLSKKALIIYEKIGILNPSRNHKNNYRYYRKEHLLLAIKINKLKELGFSLKEIKNILSYNKLKTYLEIKKNIEEQKEKINNKIQLLENTKSEIDNILCSGNNFTNSQLINTKDNQITAIDLFLKIALDGNQIAFAEIIPNNEDKTLLDIKKRIPYGIIIGVAYPDSRNNSYNYEIGRNLPDNLTLKKSYKIIYIGSIDILKENARRAQRSLKLL
ncbi:MAG: MerR family transcriptional regulator, partial [Oligoflexia bacterium]|nr:MerR family transcriptional regulator [Oligoflexia bacterium]